MAGHGVESLKASESESNDVGLLESLMEPVVKHEKKNRIGEIGLVESPTEESEVEHGKKNMIDESETKEMGLLESPVEHENKNLKAHMIGESEIIKDFGSLESWTELRAEEELNNLILDNDLNDSTSENEVVHQGLQLSSSFKTISAEPEAPRARPRPQVKAKTAEKGALQKTKNLLKDFTSTKNRRKKPPAATSSSNDV